MVRRVTGNRTGQTQGKSGRRRSGLLTIPFVICLVVALAAGCASEETHLFPTLGTTTPTQNQSSQPSDSQPTASGSESRLTVALPLSDEATQVIRLLYLAKKSGLISQEPGQYIGQSIDPDDLRQFDKGLTVTLDPLPLSTGATMLQVSLWQASAQMPDIIYCQDAIASLGLDQVIALNEPLFANPLLSAAHVYPSLLESGNIDGHLYGIPYLASTPLVYWNQTILTQLDLDLPLPTWTWQDWQAVSATAQQAIDNQGYAATPAALAKLAATPDLLAARLNQAIFVTDNPAAALPFLPASLSRTAGYALWDGQSFQMADAAFAEAAAWLTTYTLAGYSPLHLTAEQRLAAFGVADAPAARSTGRILFWIGDSSDVVSWQQQGSFPVAAVPLPAGPPDDGSSQTTAGSPTQSGEDPAASRRLPLTVRSLFVSKQCQDPQLAADFAAFVALDADSLLMQSRYGLYEGLFPVIQDTVVWDTLVGRQVYGNVLHTLRSRLHLGYCSGQQQTAAWQAVLQILEQTEGQALLVADNDQRFKEKLNQLKTAVKQKSGG
jgi:ABC-type glycerol-3-phosphate transport system substrate-binding protein